MWKIEDLEKIEKLKADGILTDEEFEIEKQKIIGSDILQDDNEIISKNNTETNKMPEESEKDISQETVVNTRKKLRICSNCGNELEEGDKFCGKCGQKLKLSKTIPIVVVILAIILFGSLIYIIIAKSHVSSTDITKILRNSDNGIYLQEDTVKIGSSIDIDFENYEQLISYSAIYINNSVTLEAGGLLLYTDNENYEIINLSSDCMAILYYLNDNNENNKLEKVVEIFGNYIKETELKTINSTDDTEKYMELGKELGNIIGVDLGRDITEDYLISLASSKSDDLSEFLNDAVFLYKDGEIFVRYIGVYTTEEEYCWSQYGISESSAKIIYENNRKSYNNLKAYWGDPYKTVTKFSVYEYADGGTSLVGSYDNLDQAKEKLEVEE